MLTSQYITEELAVRIGQTLIHSFWHIALIGFFFFFVNRALVRRSANLRYIVGCVAMVLMLVVPVCWLIFATETNPDGGSIEAASVSSELLDGVGPSEFGSPGYARDGSNYESTWASRGTPIVDGSETGEASVSEWHWLARLAATVWLVGVILFSLRPALGFAHARRLRRVGNADVPESVNVLARRVAETMHVRRVVQVAQSTLARVPCVVGWLQPVILLPASAVTGLSPAELESILAHELAHIRRHDYAVNVVQVAIETLLFFHPVMWWISRCVRREREYCCDDLALQACGDRAVLTDALLAVGGVKARSRLVLASDGTVLFERVTRILESDETPKCQNSRQRSRIAADVVSALLTAIVVSTFFWGNHEEPQTKVSLPEATASYIQHDPANIDAANDWNEPAMKYLTPDHPFIQAVREIDLPRIKELIAEDKSLVNAQVRGGVGLTGNDGKEYTPEETDEHAGAMHFASFHGHAELEQLLIDSGADLDATSYFGQKEATPVTLACWEGDPKTILRAAKAADIKLDLRPGLFTTLAHGGTTDLLMEHGVKYDFYTAAMAGELEELQRLISEDPKSLDIRHPEYGRTPLEQAVMVGQLPSAKLLAEHGAKVKPFAAATMGRVGEVKALLERDSDATKCIWGKSYTLLIWAVRGGQIDVVKLLLEHGADPNGSDHWGFTPFYHLRDAERLDQARGDMALLKGDEVKTIEKLLVDAGAAPDVTRRDANLTLDAESALEASDKVAIQNLFKDRVWLAATTVEEMFYQARTAGMSDAVVRRSFASFLPDQSELEVRTVESLVGDDESETIKLFARLVDRGEQPPLQALVREGFDDLLIEIVEHCADEPGTKYDHPNASVLYNITHATEWYGYPKLMRRLFDHPSYRYSYSESCRRIGTAIHSHNRDGGYPEYRECIVMHLEELKANGDLEKARKERNWFHHIANSFTARRNFGYRAEIAKPECYIDLAELFVSWEFDDIEYRHRKTNHSALSRAVERGDRPGKITYIRWLLEKGADLRESDQDDVNPIAIAKAKGHVEILELLQSYRGAKGAEGSGVSKDSSSTDKPSQELRNQLAAAIEANDIAATEKLLAAESLLANADLRESKDRDVFSNGHPLQRACEHNNQPLAELLLRHGSHADAPGPDPDDRPVHGMPLHLAAAEHQNYKLANLLLDHGATPNSYPNCDKATIECMFYHAREAGLSDALVRRSFASYLSDQSKLETQTATDLVEGDAAEAIKLFARMVDLGAQPPFTALVREGFDDLIMEIVEHSRNKDGTPHDHPNSSAVDNIFGAARWLGYPKLVRRLMDHPSHEYSCGGAICTISAAIGSHNRDGAYPEYRKIILLQLEALKANGDLKKAQQDSDYNPFYHMAGHFTWNNNYGYRAEIAKPEYYVDLAELFVSWGFENIEHRDPESDHSPLSRAVKRGNPTGIPYIRWLLEKGADLRKSDPDEVNPIAIAKAKGHEETLKLLVGTIEGKDSRHAANETKDTSKGK